MPSPTEITVAQLARLVGTPDAPLVLDVRIPEDVAADPTLVPGSLPCPHDRATERVVAMGRPRVIVLCQKGRKISQGVAALLRAEGVHAETLEGGHHGWRDAGLPLIQIETIPPRDAAGWTLWVTRQRPKIDRIACPWLIRRFVDPCARFLFVAPSEVMAVAERFGATPFDVEGADLTHRGERCSFDAMVEVFGLTSAPLRRLAAIVRAADTGRHDLAPEAAGLLAVSLGLSRMFRDDLAQLEAGLLVYDAFYRWARDAGEETHKWPAGHVR